MEKIVVNLSNEETLNTTLKDLNYIPAYKEYEEERQNNEIVRQNNESTRVNNEIDRETYITELKQKVDSGEFNGEKGEKGDTGNSGVYIGTDAPTDPNIKVWIDSDGEPDSINYNDASNKPKINGKTLEGNKTLNDLGIDQDFVKTESDPTVPSYVKEITEQNITDWNNKAETTDIPTKTSDLTNDSNFAKTNTNNNFSAAQTINGTLTVNGDIVQNGQSYESHAEQLFTKNDLIKTRDGAIGGLSDNELTGIEAINYDGTNNGRLAFDNKGVARVGDVGDEQPLLTRDEEASLTTGQVLVWDGINLKAIGSSNYVKNTDYATTTKGGVIKTNTSFGNAMNNEGSLYLVRATTAQIDARSSKYNPIVPDNLDYAVRSVLPLTATTVPSTLVANTEYYLGETASLSFAFPTTGTQGQYCFVKFDSGETATTLTVTGTNYVGDIPAPEASKSYEILATWNGSEWVCVYRAY